MAARKIKYRDIDVRGTVYPNVRAVAQAFSLAEATVYCALRRGTLHRIGLGKGGREPLPVRIGGVDYASAGVAAQALGVNLFTIYKALADGDPDRVVRPPRYNPWRAQPITLGAVTWPSMAAAERDLGLRPGYIGLMRRRGSARGWERVLAAAMRFQQAQAA